MAVPIFPYILPSPKYGSVINTALGLIESGILTRVSGRDINSSHSQVLTATWIFTEKQFRIFESWYIYKLYNGISLFEMDWLEGKKYGQMSGKLQARLNGNIWQVTSKVIVSYGFSG